VSLEGGQKHCPALKVPRPSGRGTFQEVKKVKVWDVEFVMSSGFSAYDRN
jgi:hypothetical protein